MKVCIIGDGLTSLSLAKALVNKDIYVDVFSKKNNINYSQTRTLGISKSNIEYFNKNILNIEQNSWKIKSIKIFTENSSKKEIIDFSESKKSLFSILQNNLLYNQLNLVLKKNKFFTYQKDTDYKNLIKKNYKLIINCDPNHEITKKFFSKQIEKNYKSVAFTTIIEHKKIISNSTAIQIFTKDGPIAFLPVSEKKTSIVYSVKNYKYDKKDIVKLIKKFNPKYKITKIGNLSQFNIKSSNLRKYYHKNILAFGDLLHKLHPLAGQGFNMSLRDIKVLTKIIEKKISLGLDIDTSICSDFEKKTKDTNYLFSKSIDWIYEFFNFESKINNQILGYSINTFLKNKSFNRFFKKIADKGINI